MSLGAGHLVKEEEEEVIAQGIEVAALGLDPDLLLEDDRYPSML